ncbi:MAG: hypothetical protein KY393_02540 [Actinobacteria bacterium]|nr:hypothetical protein [Actinomycetota bacterium]
MSLAGDAPLLLPPPRDEELTEEAAGVLEVLASGGAMFFRQIVEATGPATDTVVLHALWELVWSVLVTNDTLAAVRSLKGVGRRAAPVRPGYRRRPGPVPVSRQGPPTSVGRWSLLPARSPQETRAMAALAEQLLDRHGVLTRPAVMSEHPPGGFAGIYPVLKAMEEFGRCRRGYFVEHLGAAQFAMPGAVDRMRSIASKPAEDSFALVLAATDPANPFGAALPWPERPEDTQSTGKGHRPGRKAGALVVLMRGNLILYVERGGRTLLTYGSDEGLLHPAVEALAQAVRQGVLGKLAVERADGRPVLDSAVAKAMEAAGFRQTPKGLRLRA